MNWQLVSFFGDSTVLLPSAVVLFAVLALRKASRRWPGNGRCFLALRVLSCVFQSWLLWAGVLAYGKSILPVSADIPHFLPLLANPFMAVNLTGAFLRPLQRRIRRLCPCCHSWLFPFDDSCTFGIGSGEWIYPRSLRELDFSAVAMACAFIAHCADLMDRRAEYGNHSPRAVKHRG